MKGCYVDFQFAGIGPKEIEPDRRSLNDGPVNINAELAATESLKKRFNMVQKQIRLQPTGDLQR